jgi:hypothetical protein
VDLLGAYGFEGVMCNGQYDGVVSGRIGLIH